MGSSREKARVMEVDNGFARKGLRGDGYSSIVKLKTGDEDAAMVKDWVSFLVIGFVVFIGDTGWACSSVLCAARGLMFPTLWPLVSKLGGTELTQGFTVAAFSFGRVLSSPHFGKMSTDYGYKKVLTFAACVMIAGCFLYATAQNCYWLIAGQVVIGLGSGTLGVTRAYVADNSTKRSRTVLMAYLTALQYGGFTVTPCVGGLLSYLLGDRALGLLPGLSLTQYTAPALLMAALALSTPSSSSTSSSDDSSGSGVMESDDFGFKSESSSGESSDSDSLRQHQAMAKAARGQLGGARQLGGRGRGGMTVARGKGKLAGGRGRGSSGPGRGRGHSVARGGGGTSAARRPPRRITLREFVPHELEKRKGKEWVLDLACEGCGGQLGQLLSPRPPASGFTPRGGLHPAGKKKKGSVACYETLGTIVAIGSFGMSKPDAGFLFSSCGFLGVFALLSMKCLTAWADDIKLVFYGCLVMVASATLLFLDARIGLHGFFAAVFLMYSVGYPIGHTAVIGIFSKIVGARTQQQGSLLGWFGSAGSLARIIFPILCGVVSSEYGSNTVFSVTGVVLAGSVVVLL
ncbi:unnamed protein product, partial [Heterosigma akashiwo]